MENQFTTTFIPKKPLAQASEGTRTPVSRPVGLLSTISVIILFIAIAASVGVYFWKSIETKNVATLSESIAKIEKGFEPELITELQAVDRQLRNANTLVRNHTVISPVFDLLAASTLRPVRYTKFDIAFDETKGPQVRMSGEADGYPSIAQQSDILGASTYLKDTIFSNFFLTQRGRVSFDVSFGLKPEFVDFEKAPITNVPVVNPTIQ